MDYFMAFIVCTFVVVPIAIVTCLRVPRWTHYVRYIAACGFLFFVGWIVMMELAPRPFLDWWMDGYDDLVA